MAWWNSPAGWTGNPPFTPYTRGDEVVYLVGAAGFI